jgi:hypothetical protein
LLLCHHFLKLTYYYYIIKKIYINKDRAIPVYIAQRLRVCEVRRQYNWERSDLLPPDLGEWRRHPLQFKRGAATNRTPAVVRCKTPSSFIFASTRSSMTYTPPAYVSFRNRPPGGNNIQNSKQNRSMILPYICYYEPS